MELTSIGFTEVGRWELRGNLRSGIAFRLDSFENERVIYAFVMDGDVKYIGVCENSATTLKDRMNRFKNLQGAGTNKRIAIRIRDCLGRGKVVKIFALKSETQYYYKGLNIDLVKGLENPLIDTLKPEWNIQA